MGTSKTTKIRTALAGWLVLVAVMASLAASPQAAPVERAITSEDYARAEQMLGFNAEKLVFDAPVIPQWLRDGDNDDRFWYRKRVAGGHKFMLADPAANAHGPVFDHARLAASLSTASGHAYTASDLPFETIELLDDGAIVQFWETPPRPSATDGEEGSEESDEDATVYCRWRCNLRTYDCSGPDDVEPDPADEIESPDGKWVAFEREDNLWIRSTESDEEIQLSDDGEEHFGYAAVPQGCCSEITSRRTALKRPPIVVWSPDSAKIATHRLDERQVEDLHLLETAESRPVLHSYKYAMVGDEAVPTYTLHVFDVETRQHTPIRSDPIELIWRAERLRWTENSGAFFFVHLRRDYQRAVLYRADPNTGDARAIIEETSNTFIDLPTIGNRFNGFFPGKQTWDWSPIDNGRQIVWHSERDGWGHFYLFDGETGELENRITSGPWVAQIIVHVDEANRLLYFNAMGKDEGVDPYATLLYRVGLDGSGLTRLSPEDAPHTVGVSPSGSYFVDTYSTSSTAPVTVIRTPDGDVERTLETADISQLVETRWTPGEPFTVSGRDGATELHGYLYRPSTFDPDGEYPVIDYIYPGPQIGPIHQRGFSPDSPGQARALAELGFVVIAFDAMGTPFRSKAFHDVWYGNMADNGLIDHVHVIKQLAARHPWMDIDRVGIYGHSGGGFSSTGAILRFPDFFKVAVSGAGNHDNRTYGWSWGEKYQGLLRENADGSDSFSSQANHLLAKNLEGKLLLTYGTLDDNVHPNGTLLLVQELIKHNKDFDMLAMPNRNHGYAGEAYIVRRTWDYFVRHLLGQEPPREYKIDPLQQ